MAVSLARGSCIVCCASHSSGLVVCLDEWQFKLHWITSPAYSDVEDKRSKTARCRQSNSISRKSSGSRVVNFHFRNHPSEKRAAPNTSSTVSHNGSAMLRSSSAILPIAVLRWIKRLLLMRHEWRVFLLLPLTAGSTSLALRGRFQFVAGL